MPSVIFILKLHVHVVIISIHLISETKGDIPKYVMKMGVLNPTGLVTAASLPPRELQSGLSYSYGERQGAKAPKIDAVTEKENIT